MIAALHRLLTIMARLRDNERGCPWDLEQDFASIAPYTIEEAYEVADAIARGDTVALKDELGDLLFQVVFHARMAKAAGRRARAHQTQERESVLDGVALALPALLRAVKIQARAARIGFDWPDATGVFAKIDEEIGEL